jgi:uncharacterized repeat protein (TIGR03803 family)
VGALSRLFRVKAVIAGVLMLPLCATAQPVYEVLYEFPSPAARPLSGMVRHSNGLLYGVTADGGKFDNGTIFSLRIHDDGSSELTTVADFPLPSLFRIGSDFLLSGLVEGADGALYGTGDKGIYKVTVGGTLTLLHSIPGMGDRQLLQGLMLASDGNFYGTSVEGGDESMGAVFRMTPAGEVTTIYSFTLSDVTGADDHPLPTLVQGADGHLYGTTVAPVAFDSQGFGTIFKVTLDGTFTTLHRFDTTSDRPGNLVRGSDGAFYGFSYNQGTQSATFFKVDTSGIPTPVASFTIAPANFSNPRLVLGADGKFYGAHGPAGVGTLFSISTTGLVQPLNTIAASDVGPVGPLAQAANGRFYGETSRGGPRNLGRIFSIDAAGTLAIVQNFTGPEGEMPYTAPVKAFDGNLYLPTSGGALGFGTITRITPEGVVSVVHTFTQSEGISPVGLTAASDGFLYGTTYTGGCTGHGTIFRMSVSGALTRLHCFNGTQGRHPAGTLLASTDGFLYGTTVLGGALDRGTAFRMSPAGAFTLLYSFGKTAATVYPVGALVQAPDGHLYGALAGPGEAVGGSVFRLTKAGALSLLRTFVAEGTKPAARFQSGLTLGGDGNLYGSACCRWPKSFDIFPNGDGEIFRITPAGVFTSLYKSTSQFSMSAPIEGRDGHLYGISFAPAPFLAASIYRLSKSGEYTLLRELDATEAIGAMVEMENGVFYGTAPRGAAVRRGVVFRLTVP